jgi:hypothetical protein
MAKKLWKIEAHFGKWCGVAAHDSAFYYAVDTLQDACVAHGKTYGHSSIISVTHIGTVQVVGE